MLGILFADAPQMFHYPNKAPLRSYWQVTDTRVMQCQTQSTAESGQAPLNATRPERSNNKFSLPMSSFNCSVVSGW